MEANQNSTTLALLEKIYTQSCHCKLKESCNDKHSSDCLKHRNIISETVAAKFGAKLAK